MKRKERKNKRKVEKQRASRCGPKMERKIENNATDAVPWRSAQRGAKDAQKMRYRSFVDADAEVVTRTKEGQGIKTGALDPSDKLQLHYWN